MFGPRHRAHTFFGISTHAVWASQALFTVHTGEHESHWHEGTSNGSAGKWCNTRQTGQNYFGPKLWLPAIIPGCWQTPSRRSSWQVGSWIRLVCAGRCVRLAATASGSCRYPQTPMHCEEIRERDRSRDEMRTTLDLENLTPQHVLTPDPSPPPVRAVFKHLHGTSLAALLVEQEMAEVITVKDTDPVELVRESPPHTCGHSVLCCLSCPTRLSCPTVLYASSLRRSSE
jgi:hypothetical protein